MNAKERLVNYNILKYGALVVAVLSAVIAALGANPQWFAATIAAWSAYVAWSGRLAGNNVTPDTPLPTAAEVGEPLNWDDEVGSADLKSLGGE